ncbi:MAG: DsrE family protein [Thiohalocapsa sp.]
MPRNQHPVHPQPPPPYGSEPSYNALRLALALAKQDPKNAITVFLMADVVTGAKRGQNTPDGDYNIGMDARGLTEAELMAGALRSTMDQLAGATANGDKVLVF